MPIGRCVDYLATRSDVDMSRIAVCGSSLGGYYAARAASFEHRLAACISQGGVLSLHELWSGAGEDHGLAGQITWVFGVKTMKAAMEAAPFTLEGALEHMRCPYLIVHGGHDVLRVRTAKRVYEYAKSNGVKADFVVVSEEDTGADHCQHDNPTLGQEIMADWLVDRFGIDERQLRRAALNPLI